MRKKINAILSQEKIEEYARRLHEIFNDIEPKYTYSEITPRIKNRLPNRGFIVFFEKGENLFGMKRVAFIGYSCNIPRRLSEYFQTHSQLLKHVSKVFPAPREYVNKNMQFIIYPIENFNRKLHEKLRNEMHYVLAKYNEHSGVESWAGNRFEEIKNTGIWATGYHNTGRFTNTEEIAYFENFLLEGKK